MTSSGGSGRGAGSGGGLGWCKKVTLKWILTGIINPDDDFDSSKRSGRSRATGICIFYIFSCIFTGFAIFFDVF